MTADFSEARIRLMDHLDYARHLAAAPDFETLGGIIHSRLKGYVAAGIPQTERTLTERLGFEHHAVRYIARANEAGYLFARQFEHFSSNWVDFINANKAAEKALSDAKQAQAYKKGRSDAYRALDHAFAGVKSPIQGQSSGTTAPLSPHSPVTLTHEVHQTIDSIVKQELERRLAQLASPQTAGQDASRLQSGLRISQVLKLFLKASTSPRRRELKGTADAAVIVQFAIDFLGDPVLEAVSAADWERLDEALPDIPHHRNVPKEHRGSLYKRYRYAQSAGWGTLSRVTISTLKNRYHNGLSKFIGWAIKNNCYTQPKPVFECSDGETRRTSGALPTVCAS
ncbi:MAG: hypothetical protein RO009_03915 [Pseudorhodoplanes sp.]|nr:hypothetical protein [Pseudorhodoplanes sp.]